MTRVESRTGQTQQALLARLVCTTQAPIFLTSEQMAEQANYIGFDFTGVWQMGWEDYPLPIFKEKNPYDG
jgi:hypothetical protein